MQVLFTGAAGLRHLWDSTQAVCLDDAREVPLASIYLARALVHLKKILQNGFVDVGSCAVAVVVRRVGEIACLQKPEQPINHSCYPARLLQRQVVPNYCHQLGDLLVKCC